MPEPTDPQSWNRYSYTRNNPVNRIDPDGHFDVPTPPCFPFCNPLPLPKVSEGFIDDAITTVSLIPGVGDAVDAADVVVALVEGNPEEAFAVAAVAAIPGGARIARRVPIIDQFATNSAKRSMGVLRRLTGACNSFEAGTLVSTPDGLIPIEQLEIGDWVLGYNEETGEIGPYQITDTMFHLDPLIVYLLIDGELVATTPEHPFYTSQSEWVDAGDLAVGDKIRALDWAVGEVESVYTVSTPQLMYNLTVDTAHTFFVGDEQWLVHNAGPCDELALGFSRKLPGFKHVVPNAKNYMDLGLDPYSSTFSDDIFDAMSNAKAIHFDVSDMRYLNGPDGVLNGPAHLNLTGSTNWELRTIWDNPELLNKTTFYRNGEIISIDELQNLN